MKRAHKFGGSAAMMSWKRTIAVVSGPMIAVAYCRAAQRDEKAGYAFTAAMEWRKAACLLGLIPSAADRCWQQWERIMRLPRRLAEPIGGEPMEFVPTDVRPATEPIIISTASLAPAA